jgi:uncharacterized protein YjbI with pentapeptide repeats
VGITIKSSSDYQISENFLKGVTTNTNVSTLIENFENANLEIFSLNGTKLKNSDICSTGCVVLCPSTSEQLTIIVSGDVDGNGNIDSTDYIRVKSAFLGSLDLSEAYTKAADVDESSKIDSTDYIRIKGHFLGTYNLHS